MAGDATRAVRWQPALAALIVVVLTLSLGAWQLRRAEEKRALRERAVQVAAAVAMAIPAQPLEPGRFDGRRVSVRGRFVAERTVFIDNRTHKGVAGFHVATPVKIEGSELHVLVLRGWVPRDPRDRQRIPVLTTPEGVIVLEGQAEANIAQALELRKASPPGPDERIWQNLALERFATWSGLRLQPVLVRQSDHPPLADGLVRDWPEARVDVDKHLGYAFQWFALAAATSGLWAWLTFFRRREHASDSR
jgi:surfeit locus 1 family protein